MIDGPEVSRAAARFWTVSNMLSLSRVVLSGLFVVIMLSDVPGARWWGLAIIVVGAATDNLDGLLARRRNEISEWGKILDPLADKIGVAAIALVLFLRGLVPVWFLAALLGRDLLILIGGLYVRSVRGVVLASNTAGKWTVGVVAGTLLLLLLDIPGWWCDAAIGISVIMIIVSFGGYVARFVDVLRPGESVHGNP